MKQYKKHLRGTYKERYDGSFQRTIDSVLTSTDLLPEQKKTIKKFLQQKSSEEVKVTSLANYAKSMFWIGKVIKKPYEQYTKQDLIKYFASIKDKRGILTTTKLISKVFFKWLYPQSDEKAYPEIVRWIKIKRPEIDETEPILMPSDVKKILSKCRCLRDRAFITILYQSGARMSEVLGSKICDYKVNEFGIEMRIQESKTKKRIIQLLDCQEVIEWLNQHIYKENPQAPMFYKDKPMGEALGASGAKKLLLIAGKRSGVKKKTNAHWYRHSRLTLEATDMPESALRLFAGWSKKSNMPSRYVHLKDADVTRLRLIKKGLVDEGGKEIKDKSLATIICPKCKKKVSALKDVCPHCWMPLSQKAMLEQQKEQEAKGKAVVEVVEAQKEMINLFADIIEASPPQSLPADRREEFKERLAKINAKRREQK